MSRVDVENEILIPMQAVFASPYKSSPGEQTVALGQYLASLEVFGRDDLRAAWVAVRNSHTKRDWPLPAVFFTAAGRAKYERETAALGVRDAAKRTVGGQKVRQNHWPTWEGCRRGEKALEAARRGVAWSFKCLILQDGKRPQDIDLDRLVREKASAERLADKVSSDKPLFGPDGRNLGVVLEPNKENLAAMWLRQLQNEAETAQEIGFSGSPIPAQNFNEAGLVA